MPEFLSIPVWIGFAVLIAGSAYKLFTMAALAKKEKTVFPTMSGQFGLRSVLHWVVPFNTRNMRIHPVMTVVSFLFHICLLVTPLFVMGHGVLWQQRWGFSWWSLPPLAADLMTLIVIFACAFFFVRRIAAPEVRNVSTWREFAIVLLVASPYLTGFVAHQQWLPYSAIITLHIVFGILWLVAIPFTWLAHMLWFVFTRAYMGSEFGAVRNARDW